LATRLTTSTSTTTFAVEVFERAQTRVRLYERAKTRVTIWEYAA
jgi:hypothetical protein